MTAIAINPGTILMNRYLDQPMKLEPFLSPKPWYTPLAIWRQWEASQKVISQKAFARLEAVKYHLEGVPIGWRDGFVLVQRPGSLEFTLDTDLKRPEDFAALLGSVDGEIRRHLPEQWDIIALSDRPTWYKRSGFRIAWPITCNVYFAPEGDWARAWIDLGAISAD